jgi:peptidoglycan/LPS O-acetylase OafA/YrhL
MLLLRHGMYFGLGIFVWLGHARRLRPIDGLGIGLGVTLALLEIHARAVEIAGKTQHLPGAVGGGTATILAALAFILVAGGIVAATVLWPGGLVGRPWLRLLGLLTFPFYLLHEVVGGAVAALALREGMPRPAALAAALAATGLAAWLVLTQLEPWLRRRLAG